MPSPRDGPLRYSKQMEGGNAPPRPHSLAARTPRRNPTSRALSALIAGRKDTQLRRVAIDAAPFETPGDSPPKNPSNGRTTRDPGRLRPLSHQSVHGRAAFSRPSRDGWRNPTQRPIGSTSPYEYTVVRNGRPSLLSQNPMCCDTCNYSAASRALPIAAGRRANNPLLGAQRSQCMYNRRAA